MPVNPDRRVKLTRSVQLQFVEGSTLGYKFTIVTSDANLMPNEIFKLRRHPVDPQDPESDPINDFQGICSPTELNDLPVDNPDPPDDLYRSATVELTYYTQQLGDDAWEGIKSDVDLLKSSLDISDTLDVEEEYWVGEPP